MIGVKQLEQRAKKHLPLTHEEVAELDRLQFPEIVAFADSTHWRYGDWVATKIWMSSTLNGKVSMRNFI